MDLERLPDYRSRYEMPIAKRHNSVHGGVAARLLELRRSHSLTQETFAAKLGVPKSTFVAWERDEAEPPLRLALAINEVFGRRSAAELIGLMADSRDEPGLVDWPQLGRLCVEVEKLARRAGYNFETSELVEIAGIVYERGEGDFEQGLRDAEQLLRIGNRIRRTHD